MCRSHNQGRRRCTDSPSKKVMEALRKAVGYQAKKAGVSSAEWKAANPDLLEVIQDTYQAKLHDLKEQEQLANPTGKAHTPALSYANDNNEESITGTVTPLQAAKIRPIEEYGFKAPQEPRLYEGTYDFDEYMEECKVNSRSMTETQEQAVKLYTYDLYEPLNKYFIRKDVEHIFDKDVYGKFGGTKWSDDYNPSNSSFYDEEDLIDYATKLDSVLEKRNAEPQILYRGAAFYPEEEGMTYEEKRAQLESSYALGNEIAFDGYSSTTVIPEVASSFSRMQLKNNHQEMFGVQYEMKTSAGIAVAHISGNDEEREIVLPRGMNYKVVNSYWDSGDYEYESIYHDDSKEHRKNKNCNMFIVQLVEVDANGEEVTGDQDYIAPPIKRL